MIKSVNNYPISQLFDIDAGFIYVIPLYQREYTWGATQWESLFDDIEENDPGYFLGSIICINQTTDAFEVQKLELVDGQQRLTTLSLLFAALYGTLKAHENALNEDQLGELISLKRKLVLKKGVDQLRLLPQKQNNNQNDFRAILSEIGVISQVDTPRFAGNRRIFKAYRYFQDRIQKLLETQGTPVEIIMAFLEKLSQASLVKIEVGSHADAYKLFESLNNRGIPLTAIDLIKNKLLAQLETTEPGMVEHYFKVWNKLLDFLGDDYSVQERFFRHYYNAFKESLNEPFRNVEDKKKDPLGPIATRSNLIQIYEKLFNQDASNHLQKIRKAGELYALMLSKNSEDQWRSINKQLRDLERIQGAPSYLLMLYLLVRRDELYINVDHLGKITQLLVSFFVRRNLTDTPPTRDLTRFFMDVIEKIATESGDAVVKTIREEILRVSASDESFRNKLQSSIYEENAGVTRFILCALAEQGMTKETWVDLWSYEGKQFIWTIEHIFPQGENIPESWVSMMANGDRQLAISIQESHAHKLGNLTISGFNSALGNKSYLDKRDRKDSTGKYIGYKNNLNLNHDLALAESWSVEQIDLRGDELAEKVMVLFHV